jgi:hypothetical protein
VGVRARVRLCLCLCLCLYLFLCVYIKGHKCTNRMCAIIKTQKHEKDTHVNKPGFSLFGDETIREEGGGGHAAGATSSPAAAFSFSWSFGGGGGGGLSRKEGGGDKTVDRLVATHLKNELKDTSKPSLKVAEGRIH